MSAEGLQEQVSITDEQMIDAMKQGTAQELVIQWRRQQGENIPMLEHLVLLQLEAGMIDDAEDTLRQAYVMASEQGDITLAGKFQEQLANFKPRGLGLKKNG